jgi:hypothetical protein
MRLAVLLPPAFAFIAAMSVTARADDDVVAIPEASYPALAETAPQAEGFVPPGWKIESQVTGNLDGDGAEDIAMVLRGTDPRNVLTGGQFGETPFDSNPRILAVALRNSDGGYRLALENHRLIPRPDDPSREDPLSETGGISIERGTLKVAFYLFMSAGGWGMGDTSYRFRLEKGRFRLIGYDSYSVNRGTGDSEEVSVNLLTGKVVITTGNIGSDAARTETRRLRKKAVLTIDDLRDGAGFVPEY